MKLTFKIRQHTPMIHFLHDQTGATLRTTELKPKLDGFLIRHAFGNDFERYKKHLAGWKPGKQESDFEEKKAFDYKIKIESPQPLFFDIETSVLRAGVYKTKQFPLFFGNLGEKETGEQNEKKFVFSFQPVPITFFSFDKEILNHIENHFAVFLFRNNFGTRQSKGFGSFYLDENDRFYKNPKHFPIKFHFSAKPKPLNSRANTEDIHQHFYYLFSDIDLLYKALRSGINHNFYFKSLMFMYSKESGIQWEKKTIKQTYFPEDLKKQITKHTPSDVLEFSSDNRQLRKDLMGLSTTEDWRYYKSRISKKHPDIDRFKSPITFKILKRNGTDIYDVFLHTTLVDKGFLHKEFLIQKNGEGNLRLKTPIDFSVNHFLEYAFTKIDLKNHVQNPQHQTTREFKTISRIFDEIRNNLKEAIHHG